MSGGGLCKQEKKQAYFDKLTAYLDTYQKVVVVGADNVGSNQLQKIRHSLRGTAEILMGKNTMVRKALREYVQSNPKVEPLLGVLKHNVGFVFTNGDFADVAKKLLQRRGGIMAKAGAVAPHDVIVPRGPTGLEPQQTTFLHALNVASKIKMGQIELLNDVHLIKAGAKVGPSEATLLQKLNIKPFSYGLSIFNFYDDGQLYDSNLLAHTHCCDNDFRAKFATGIDNVASLSLSLGLPTMAALPHALADAYKQVLAIAVETEYSFAAAEDIKAQLTVPSATILPDDELPLLDSEMFGDSGDEVEVGDLFADW